MSELPSWLKVQYPFEQHAYNGEHGTQNYVDEGEGEAVVFLHGNPTWSFFYRNLIIDLRSEYRCLAIDHLGCGLSEKPQSGNYTLSGHIENTIKWLDSLKIERFHLVVHDWGGAIGMGVVKELSEKIASIHVLNTAAFTFKTIPFRIALCRVPVIGTWAVRGLNAFVRAATFMTTVNPLPQAVKDGFVYPYGNWNDRVAIDRFVKDIPMNSRHPSYSTLEAIEEAFEVFQKLPVHIIWGMEDWCFHKGALAKWEQLLPDAPVTRLEQAGHYLLEDELTEVSDSIRSWLEANRDSVL